MRVGFWRRFRLALGAVLMTLLSCAAATSRAQAPDLSGWWQATIERQGERAMIYLHLDRANDHNRARFAIPMVRTYEARLGTYEVVTDNVRFPALDWTMRISSDGNV